MSCVSLVVSHPAQAVRIALPGVVEDVDTYGADFPESTDVERTLNAGADAAACLSCQCMCGGVGTVQAVADGASGSVYVGGRGRRS